MSSDVAGSERGYNSQRKFALCPDWVASRVTSCNLFVEIWSPFGSAHTAGWSNNINEGGVLKMRIDHGPVQTMQVHHNRTSSNGNLSGTTTGPHEKENFRILPTQSEDSSGNNHEIVRLGSKVDGFERKGQQWFVATELQSDLAVEIGDLSFHLHKFPLLSRSGKLNRLVFDSRDVENSHIKLDDIPGGPETFELAAKFCYGVSVELTAANVAALRCAAEYLEMTEDLEEGNLVSKTEAFLTFVVLASWKDSVAVLQSCEKLLPWAEDLQIVRRCCESIAWKACTDPRGIRWSFTERAEAMNHASPIWNGTTSNSISEQVPSDWWFEDVCVVCVSFFTKIIAAIRVKGMRFDLIGSVIVHYAIKWLPELTRHSVPKSKEAKEKEDEGKPLDLGSVHDKNRLIVETLVGILPNQKDAVPCTFLLRMLRLAKMLSINPDLITELEKRAGLLLDQGTLSDLLIPCFNQGAETLFDVDLVQRLLDYFLLQDFASTAGSQGGSHSEDKGGATTPEADKMHPQSAYAAKMRVAKLIDNYLAEVGRDQNLALPKFLALAEALPEQTRVTDDGLYKALDTYLKAHPLLTEHDRKKLCRTLDCQRLSLDACMHAAQNERLPLRLVVQVLFGEQIKLRNEVAGSTPKDGNAVYGHEGEVSSSPGAPTCSRESTYANGRLSHEKESNLSNLSKHHSGHHSHGSGHHADPDHHSDEETEEVRVLRSDMEKMKGKFMALQHDYTAIQEQLEKLTKHPKPPTHNHKDHHHRKDHHHDKDHHSHHSGWKKLIPHPHFHLPHVLTHPLELFHHHKDHHHHHGKDHHSHGHGKDHHDHHGHGKDNHHGHGHHGKDSHHDHGHGHHGKESHHRDHGHHGKDHHHHDHGPHHGKDSHHHAHRHHSKDSSHHGTHHDHHGKDSYHDHSHGHHHGKDGHHHEHGKGHHDKDGHHGHGHGHGRDSHSDHGHDHGKDSHHHSDYNIAHSHGKDIHHDHGHPHGLDYSNHGSQVQQHSNGSHHSVSSDTSKHSENSKHSHRDHDSSAFHHHHHSKETPRPSKDHDLLKEYGHPLYVKEAFNSSMGPEAFKESIIQARGHHASMGPEAFKESIAAAHSHAHQQKLQLYHSKDSSHLSKDSTQSKDEHHHSPYQFIRAVPELKEYSLNIHEHPYVPKGSHPLVHEEARSSKDSTHSAHDSVHNNSEHHKNSEPRLSNSHLSSGENSSRSMEGPTTPTHPIEHKNNRHFANAIRKWRNSIS
ncbi:hypothetical protein R1flu_002138 [Riccia fluitans]|uniref:BTB/POZ domain-containing protein n=1 Tax=Riccia fluitans TaxID=41844 RepID=A0ABD1Y5J3_9MARC